jgi:hypothetical protein
VSGWNGFCFSGGAFFSFAAPSARNTYVYGLNTASVVVGSFEDQSSKSHGYYAWKTNFGVVDFPGAAGTWVTGVDDYGDVVGYYDPGDGKYRGFFVAPGENFVDVALPGCVSTALTGINNSADLLGQCQLPGGEWVGFIDVANNIGFFSATGASPSTFPQSLALNGDEVVGYADTPTKTESGWATGKNPYGPWPADNSQLPNTVLGKFDWDYAAPTGARGLDGVPLGVHDDVELILQPDGTAALSIYIEDREASGGGPVTCIQQSIFTYNGTYTVQGINLYLTLQGLESTANNCLPATNLHNVPVNYNFDFRWVEGVAIDGKTRLNVDTGLQAPLDHILFCKTSSGCSPQGP